MPHVVTSISSSLGRIDPAWTLESESRSGKIWRLNLLVKYEWAGVGRFFREERFDNAMINAVRSGDIDVLEWWLQDYSIPESYGDPFIKTFTRSVECGNVKILEWLHAKGKLRAIPSEIKVECNHLHIAQWIHENIPNLQFGISPNTDFDFIKWAHENRFEVKNVSNVINTAVDQGLRHILEWVHVNRPERCSEKALETLLQKVFLDIAVWLYENYPQGYFQDPMDAYQDYQQIEWIVSKYEWVDLNKRDKWVKRCILYCNDSRATKLLFEHQYYDEGQAMNVAARKGSLDMVEWLHRHQAKATHHAMDRAAANGHLEVVKWLHNNRSEGCTVEAMNEAARNNHMEVIKWLHANRFEGCTTIAMNKAATNGHLTMVKWLHANRTEGCTIDAMDRSAANGHLEVVQWLHANRTEGCTTRAMNHAIYYRHLDMAKWLHQHRTEGCTAYAMDVAAAYQPTEVIRWLQENRSEGCTTRAMDRASAYGKLGILKSFNFFMNIEGCTAAMDKAAQNGHFDIVKYLHEHRQEGCLPMTLEKMIWREDFDMVKWFCLHRPEGGSPMCVEDACWRGDFEMVKFLTLQGHIYCDFETLQCIFWNYRRFDIVEWLLKHYHAIGHKMDGYESDDL